MSGFDDKQLGELRAPLSREHVKGRQQAGRQVSYIEGWHVIAEANRIFGFDGWDRETVDCRCVAERQVKIGQNKDRDGWRIAYVGKVRVTIRAGDRLIVREGTGYGSGIDADPGEAHESAIKECETDCMKRALMTFGNPFGLALYDKTMSEVEPARGAATAQKAAAPPQPSATGNGHQAAAAVDPDRAKARERAVKARDNIVSAIEAAKTPSVIDEVVKVYGKDLEFIKEYHEPTYDRLIALSNARKTEMYASA